MTQSCDYASCEIHRMLSDVPLMCNVHMWGTTGHVFHLKPVYDTCLRYTKTRNKYSKCVFVTETG